MWYNLTDMNPKLITKKLNRKSSSEEIINAGDYCLIQELQSSEEKIKPIKAIVMKCPFCRMDMASTSNVTIFERRSWIRRICGLPSTITVLPMLQCPYVPSHKFKIKNSKVLSI